MRKKENRQNDNQAIDGGMALGQPGLQNELVQRIQHQGPQDGPEDGITAAKKAQHQGKGCQLQAKYHGRFNETHQVGIQPATDAGDKST